MLKEKGFAPIIIILGIVLIIGAIGGAYYYGTQKNTSNPVPKAPSACTQEAKICPDGTSVGRTGPNCEFTPCPTISPVTSDETVNWKTYSNSKYGFSIKYPIKTNESLENWQYGESGSNNIFSVGFGTPSSKSGGYIWGIWITENGNIENLIKQMGNQFADRKEKRENININGVAALLVTVTTEQVKEFKWILKNVYIQKDNKVYSIDNGANDSLEFELFYNSFKFLDSSTGTAKYTCPENGYQNCMPILDAVGQKQCSKEALDWKSANCPNFSGAAY